MYKKNFILIAGLSLFFSAIGAGICVAQEQAQTISADPVVFAPSGLSEKEQSELERQYRQKYRHKDIVLSPYISYPGASVDGAEITDAVTIEKEKLHRYFGIASQLEEEGRLKEAVEIMKYLSYKDPDDEYIKSYLQRLERRLKGQDIEWKKTVEREARALRRKKINGLHREGRTYYRQKNYDMALVKFADLLSLDPNHDDANRYMKMLKVHFLKEISVDNIIEQWQSANAIDSKIETTDRGNYINRLLDEEDKITQEVEMMLDKKDEVNDIIKEMLDEEELNYILARNRAKNMLDKADLGLRIEDMISKIKKEEKRSRVFTLGAGDTLQISVRDHPELSGSTTVRIKGDIIMPLTNEVVQAKDLTVEELTEKIKEKMERYVRDPAINITVLEYKSRVFYVIDESGSTPYPITRANFTIRDALFASDWGSGRALGRVIVMKPSKTHPIIKKVDAFDIIYRGRLANNIKIDNGDVIYIPMTAASKITEVIGDTIAPLSATTSAIDELEAFKTSYHSMRSHWKEFPHIGGGGKGRKANGL